MVRLETQRLILRPPLAADFDAWAELAADAEVMRHLGGAQPRPLAWRSFLFVVGGWQIQGFSPFSVIEKETGRWIGRAGPLMPEGWPGTEVGWTFASQSWGNGYATESALAVVAWAFDHLGWKEVIHCIDADHVASQNVAKRLGSHPLRQARLPPPYENTQVDIWGQSRAEWLARREHEGALMITVYGYSPSGNCHKLRMLLGHLGLDYRWIETDSARGATRTPAYLAKNPNGRVPMIELDDGRRMVESNAILYWLADGTPYFGGDAWRRSQTLAWMFFEQYSHEPYIAVARFICGWTPADSPRRAELPQLRERGHQALAVMQRHLAATPWFSGPAYGIADIALFAYTHCAADGGFDLSAYPAILDWLERVRAQPGFVAMPT